MTAEQTSHRVTWWVWAGSKKIRRTAKMRGTWGYDVTCSCGWETRTGGAVKRHIANEVYFHKLFTAADPAAH